MDKLCQQAGCVVSPLLRQQARYGLGLDVDIAKDLTDGIMKIARQPLAFLRGSQSPLLPTQHSLRLESLLMLAVITVMIGLLKGAAAEAGADLYEVMRNMYS